MISINTDKGADLLLELIRQSQIIKKNMEKTKSDSLDEKDNKSSDAPSNNTRVSLRSPNTDGSLMLSRKGDFIRQRNKDESYHQLKGWIEDILNRMTAQDYKRLSEAGFQVEDLTVESLTNAVQLIKDYGNNNENTLKNKKESKKSPGYTLEDEIKVRMNEENLPINKESIERVMVAMDLSEAIAHMDRKDVLYLLRKDLSPTIENIYKARYSSQNNEAIIKLSDDEWTELVPQVSEAIMNSGNSVNSNILEAARELIENHIPLSKENINIMIGLEDLSKGYDRDMVMDGIFMGMKEGKLPGEINLIEKANTSYKDMASHREVKDEGSNINQLLDDIHDITEDEIVNTVDTDQDLTIKNLIDNKNEMVDAPKKDKASLSYDRLAKVITAKRQLEEIRLKMTMEAAQRLEKQGFNIETEALEKVVDRLRLEEENYYKEFYNHIEIDSNEDSIQMLQMTVRSMDELKFIPAHVLGRTLNDRETQTVSGLLDVGRSILAEIDRAREAYETLFTRPKAEYGDSIKKAFANVGSLMEEMGIENTQYNYRAIRILGYNQMEITKDSIDQIKAYDLRVNYLIQNLNPGIVHQMIKDGINPMDIPIDKLNDRIDELKEQGYSSLDKYSSYLYRLEREEGITEEERKAYIGIYRLLYQIEKSDGAALGAVIKSDQKVTLNHLLTAVQSTRKGGMDYKINDGFGLLQEVSFEKELIADQIKAVFNEMTPASLQDIHNSILTMSFNSEGEQAERGDIWETIGDIPIEQLLEQIQNTEGNPSEDQVYYHNKLRELQEIYSNSDQAIGFLNELKLPCSTTNLMMAGQILNNSTTVFRKLYGLIKDEKDENKKNDLKKKLDLVDTLIDSETMYKAYEQLEQEVKDVIEKEAVQEDMDFNRLTHLRSMGMQMHFMRDLAMREFYHIPMILSGKTTNINLTIIRGKLSSGKVSVTLISERLGSIKAEASLKDGMLSGYIACDHVEGLKALESQAETLKLELDEESISIKQLNFFLQQSSDAINTYQNSLDLDGDKHPDGERILYRVAKAMIHMIQSAEETDKVLPS